MAAKTRPDVDVLTEIGVIDRLVTAGLERVLPLGLSAAAFDVLAHFAQGHASSSPLALAEATHVGIERLEVLNDLYCAWADRVANTRIHAETKQTPIERFEASLGAVDEEVRRQFYADNFRFLMGSAGAGLAA